LPHSAAFQPHLKLTEKRPSGIFAFRNPAFGGAPMLPKLVGITGLAGVLMSLGLALSEKQIPQTTESTEKSM